MAPQLTAGVIKRILNSEQLSNVVVQVLGYKKVPGSGTSDRYRLLISDGDLVCSFAMLGTQLNHMVSNNELEKFTVIRVNKYVCNHVTAEKKIVILLDISVLASGGEISVKLGNPVVINQAPTDSSASNVTVKKEPVSQGNSLEQVETSYNAASLSRPSANPFVQNGAAVNVHPIKCLTPYQNKWTIKARVTNKQPIRYWNNSRGEGKLFSVNFLDESGEIRATGFNDAVDKFYELLEINKVYYISKGTLKPANKNFSSVKNEYEMHFSGETTVVPCEDSTAIPMLQFEFMPISQIEQVEKNNSIDVIGVCKNASEVTTIMSRKTNKELVKREVKLVDTSGVDIKLTLWGTDAEKFDPSQNPVVAIKGALVSEFNGKSLSVVQSSVLQINPDIKEAHVLKGWYDREGCHMESTSLSSGLGRGSEGVWKNFSQVTSENLGMGDKPDYYNNKATVVLVRKENCMYMACPTDECNKKVIDMNNGNYRCEKCNREYPNFKWRLMLSMSIADFVGNQWVVCFQDAAEAVLGITSQELGSIRESDEDRFNDIIAEANFKSFIFNLRTKMEVFNEESRLKTQVLSAAPVDYVSYGKRLLKELKSKP